MNTLVSSGLNLPYGVAVDGAGNLYIADSADNAIKKWTLTNNVLTTLASSGLNNPNSVAVDGAGNVYVADTGNNAIKEWVAASSNLTTLVWQFWRASKNAEHKDFRSQSDAIKILFENRILFTDMVSN